MFNLQIVFHELIDFHYCSLISASVAVVRCGEDRHDIALVCPVVAVHDELMSARNPRQVIGVVELLRDVLAEAVAGTTRGDAPTAALIGVGPQQVADGALVRSLLHAIKLTDLV